MENQSKYQQLSQEVKELRKKVLDLAKQKEEWFKKKEELKTEIRNKINAIKSEKTNKDQKSIELQELKKQRENYNGLVKNLISEVKTLDQEKKKLSTKYDFKTSPARIERMIDELEKKVETEVSFKKEQELMQQIRKLKKEYGESNEIRSFLNKSKKVSIELRETKAKAQEFHKKIQSIAKDTNYKELIELSKEISKIKKTQEEAFNKFIECKNIYLAESKLLKEKQKQLNEIKVNQGKSKEFRKEKEDEKKKRIIEEKTKEVEQKIKENKKLTTEDFLTFQAEENLKKD